MSAWIAMSKAEAIEFANLIIDKAEQSSTRSGTRPTDE